MSYLLIAHTNIYKSSHGNGNAHESACESDYVHGVCAHERDHAGVHARRQMCAHEYENLSSLTMLLSQLSKLYLRGFVVTLT